MAKKVREEAEEGADIISSLPEEIRSHIISFLPLGEAIRTCLLSRKWRKIFTLISNFHINECFTFSRMSVFDIRRVFVNLVDGFLSCRTGFVDKVRIRCSCYNYDVDIHDIDAWILYALRNKVKQLDVNVDIIPYNLPIETVFTCDTLEVLRLKIPNVVGMELPANICLPNLKCLRLVTWKPTLDFDCDGDDSIQRFLPSLKFLHLSNVQGLSLQAFTSSCSALEELVITSCSLRQGCDFNVFKTSLKRLVMDNVGAFDKDSVLSFHGGFCLPSLSCLHLEALRNFDGDSIQRFISSCSALEELVIRSCRFKKSREFNVFNPTLKRLTMSGVEVDEEFCEIGIDAPSLVSFDSNCCQPFLLKNLNSQLIKVCEGWTPCFHPVSSRSVAIYLFKGIGNVQSLHLSLYYSVEVLLEANRIKPELPKLTYLKLDIFDRWERVLPDFLSCFPHLEALDLKGYSPIHIDMDKFTQLSSLWSPVLKRLHFLYFEGKYNEMQIVGYFLKNAKALENFTIEISRRSRRYEEEEWRSKITETVLNLPKISTNCKILVV